MDRIWRLKWAKIEFAISVIAVPEQVYVTVSSAADPAGVREGDVPAGCVEGGEEFLRGLCG